MYAVMALATEPIGTPACLPKFPIVPMPLTSIQPWPSVGHGRAALLPSKLYESSAVSARVGVGSGRAACTIAKTITRSSTSGVQILTLRTIVRTGVSGGGGVFVSSASRSSGGFGGRGCWAVRSGPTCGTWAVASAGFLVGGSSSGLSATKVLVRSASDGSEVFPGAFAGLFAWSLSWSLSWSWSFSAALAAAPSLSMVVGWSTWRDLAGSLKTAVG